MFIHGCLFFIMMRSNSYFFECFMSFMVREKYLMPNAVLLCSISTEGALSVFLKPYALQHTGKIVDIPFKIVTFCCRIPEGE